jgi:ribonuclease HI
MILTINTDAAYNRKKNFGSYAFYLRSDRIKILKSGIIAEPINNHLCEIQAILNALFIAEKLEVNFDSIIINTDSDYAINFFKDKPTYTFIKSREKYQIQWSFFKEIRRTLAKKHKKETLKTLIFRKVKAHQRGKLDSRSWVNNLCDLEAKKALKTAFTSQ